MNRRRTLRGRSGRRSDRGLAVLEFAIVAPLLALLAAGIIEFGMAWRDDLTISNATRSSARVASNLGDNNLADYEALLSVEAALGGLNGATLEGVLIYDPSINNGDPANACFSGGTPQDSAGGRCNFYSAADIASMTTATFSTIGSCGSWDQYYCPINRSTSAGTLDDVGVWLRIDRSWFTEVFPVTESPWRTRRS